MKGQIPRSLPQIVIVIVIIAVGASIVLNQLGISFSAKPSSAPSGAPQQAASPAAAAPKTSANAAGNPNTAGNTSAAGAGRRTIAVRAATIASGSISNYTKIHGDVVSSNEVKIYPNLGGKLLERKVSIGDRVEKGTEIALVDPSKVGQTFMPNPVESTVSGTVLSIPVSVGDTISATTVIATVGNLSRTRISTAVPERYLMHLRIGAVAQVNFDAIPGAVFSARVVEMSPVVDTASRTLDVKLELERADQRVLVGMFATVRLVTESRQNVLILPRSAVSMSSTDSYVYIIKANNTVEQRSVLLGLEGEESFEVVKGIKPGEKVVTEGKNSVASGDSVRIVNGTSGSEAGAAK